MTAQKPMSDKTKALEAYKAIEWDTNQDPPYPNDYWAIEFLRTHAKTIEAALTSPCGEGKFREYVSRMLGYAPDHKGRLNTPDNYSVLVAIGQEAIKYLNSAAQGNE